MTTDSIDDSVPVVRQIFLFRKKKTVSNSSNKRSPITELLIEEKCQQYSKPARDKTETNSERLAERIKLPPPRDINEMQIEMHNKLHI